MNSGVVKVDLHGKNVYQARVTIDALLRRSKGVYRLHIIHGYHGGSQLRELVREEYANHPQVLRAEYVSAGATELILREFC